MIQDDDFYVMLPSNVNTNLFPTNSTSYFHVHGDRGILFFRGRRCLLIFQAQAFRGFEFFIRHSIKMYLEQRKNCKVIGDIDYYY